MNMNEREQIINFLLASSDQKNEQIKQLAQRVQELEKQLAQYEQTKAEVKS